MSTWPTGNIPTTNVDESTDDPSQARANFKTGFDRVNDILGSRGLAEGVASLDSSGNVPTAQLTNAMIGSNNLSDVDTVATARSNLGSGVTGDALFTAATATAARATLDAQQASLAVLKAGSTMSGALSLFGAPTTDLHAATKLYADTAGALVGEVKLYGPSSAPSGWVFCDGQELSRATFVDLFAAISTIYGIGDGSTTFNVPDFRGRMPIGEGVGAGLTSRVLGTFYGSETFVLATANLSVHAHGQIFRFRDTYYSASTSRTWADNIGGYGSTMPSAPTNNQSGTQMTSNEGSATAKAHQGPSQCINFIIKT